MVWILVLVGWLAASVVMAVLFAAIGRSALREDQALGYVEPDGLVPAGDWESEAPVSSAEPVGQEVVRSSVSR
jgi:hypothetical protein